MDKTRMQINAIVVAIAAVVVGVPSYVALSGLKKLSDWGSVVLSDAPRAPVPQTGSGLPALSPLPQLSASDLRTEEARKAAFTYVASRSVKVISNDELTPRDREVTVVDHDGKTCRVGLHYSGRFAEDTATGAVYPVLPSGWLVSSLKCTGK